MIDDELKFHKQTSAVIKKANMVLGIVKKSFACFDSKTLPLLYSHWYLEYGNVVWGPYYKADMKAIEGSAKKGSTIDTCSKE